MAATLLLVLIYLSFVSMGLPDSMLGAAWPMMYNDIGALLSQAGVISMVICSGTIVSAFSFVHLRKRFSTGTITSASIFITASSLFGFSLAPSFWALLPIGFLLGLGGGCVDSAINNYVSAHYSTGAMSFLHGFWGVGTTIGPMILGLIVPLGYTWRTGYRTISLMQASIFLLSLLMFPLWAKSGHEDKFKEKEEKKLLGYGEAIKKEGVSYALLAFFAYCSTEVLAFTWGASYMVSRGITEAKAATWVSFLFWGITFGRMLTGFVAGRLGDWKMIRIGAVVLGPAILSLFVVPKELLFLPFFLLGIGCAPMYPMMLHETNRLFGEEATPALFGLQMTSAYIGSTFMPPVFGLASKRTGLGFLPMLLLALFLLTLFCTEKKAALLMRKGVR